MFSLQPTHSPAPLACLSQPAAGSAPVVAHERQRPNRRAHRRNPSRFRFLGQTDTHTDTQTSRLRKDLGPWPTSASFRAPSTPGARARQIRTRLRSIALFSRLPSVVCDFWVRRSAAAVRGPSLVTLLASANHDDEGRALPLRTRLRDADDHGNDADRISDSYNHTRARLRDRQCFFSTFHGWCFFHGPLLAGFPREEDGGISSTGA